MTAMEALPISSRHKHRHIASCSGAVFLVLGLYVVVQLDRPEVLLVGDVTVDVVPDGSRPAGGSITYAAAALNALGIRACVVTVAGPDADLTVFAPHELHVIPSPVTLTFEHTYTWWGHERQLRVTADPNITLSRHMVPKHCQRARLVVLGPLVLHDVDAGSFLTYDSLWDRLMRGPWQRVLYMSQGAQRRLGAKGAVMSMEMPSDVLLDGLGRQVSMFMSEVETGVWPAAEVARVARQLERLVITQGDKGAEEWNSTGVYNVPVFQVDSVVDTNGAGDTFAIMYGLAMAWGHPDPGTVASFAAGLAVQQPQACKPACVGHSWAHLAQPWSLYTKLAVDLPALGPHLVRVAAAAAAPLAASAAAAAAAARAALLRRLPVGLGWPVPVPSQPIWPLRAPGALPPPPLKAGGATVAAPSASVGVASLLQSLAAAVVGPARQGGDSLQQLSMEEVSRSHRRQYTGMVAAAPGAPPGPELLCRASGVDTCGGAGGGSGAQGGCGVQDQGLEEGERGEGGICPAVVGGRVGKELGAFGRLKRFVVGAFVGLGGGSGVRGGEEGLQGGEVEEP